MPYGHLAAALICGALLRWFFISHFNPYAGDAKFYEELARNWLDHGVLWTNLAWPVAADRRAHARLSGILAAIYRTLGNHALR